MIMRSIFFLNSEDSISIGEEISKEKTTSPWIYNELSIADLIEIRPVKCHRKEILHSFSEAYDELNKSFSLTIKYEVYKMLKSFITLSYDDLINCVEKWKENDKSFESALDYIYLEKI